MWNINKMKAVREDEFYVKAKELNERLRLARRQRMIDLICTKEVMGIVAVGIFIISVGFAVGYHIALSNIVFVN